MSKTLKETINLTRMKDDQLSRQRRLLCYPYNNRIATSQSTNAHAPLPGSIKMLSWDEMQRRRAQGLCFNCNEKLTMGHKCQGLQLLLF